MIINLRVFQLKYKTKFLLEHNMELHYHNFKLSFLRYEVPIR